MDLFLELGRSRRSGARRRRRGTLRLSIEDGLGRRELGIFDELRVTLVPRLAQRLREHGHVVRDLKLPSEAAPFPGSRFAWEVETVDGPRVTISCELRPRWLWRSRVGSVRYAIQPVVVR